jgi:hypothetical protein
MSALVTFPKLVVEIARDRSTLDLAARVVQGNLRGDDLLAHRHVRRIDSAKLTVVEDLVVRGVAKEIEFVVSASADTEQPFGAHRNELNRETRS